MRNVSTGFNGSIVAIITPFKDNRVDTEAWEKMVEWHIEEGTQGIVVCGTTGESATLSHDEQRRAVATMVGLVNSRIPVIAGAGSNSTAEAVSLAKNAEECGADGILSVTPYYNKPTPAGLVEHYRHIRKATELPIILYNVPSRTGINMDPDTVLEISKLGGIDSVKEASGSLNQSQEILSKGIRILSGEDGLTFPLMAIGASGVISVVANFAPRIMRQLCNAIAKNDLLSAREIHQIVYSLSKIAFSVTNPIPAKAALAALGFCREEYRLPLTPMGSSERNLLLQAMKRYQLL